MGGFFGVVSHEDCSTDLFYGTDYHSHLGTCRGGLAVRNGRAIARSIHDITNAQFRSKFEDEMAGLRGTIGIGVISDNESQPLIVGSHLGTYAIVTVGHVTNIEQLAKEAFVKRTTHFSEMSGGGINPTELIATLINNESNFTNGIRYALERIEGSCSLLLMTDEGIYAGRDWLGRTPIVLGHKEGARVATMETTALANLGYEVDRYLGPGEIVRLTADGAQTMSPPRDRMQICTFLWIYYGFPASSYEGINVEAVRNRCGQALARRDRMEADIVTGIPDSGTGHALGYAAESRVPYRRPFSKYTPTWPRSFMPQDQNRRDLVARMKLIPIKEFIDGQRIVFCEDSIVRGTQLKDTIERLYHMGAREVHMRVACPPLVYGCRFLHFSRSRSEMDLAARIAIHELEGEEGPNHLEEYADPRTERHEKMVESIRKRLHLTTLKYNNLEDMVEAVGLPKEKLCTYCWDGCAGCGD